MLSLFMLCRLSCTSSNIVILSIHQPRYSIFKLFNSLTLLSRGKVVFHGPAPQALPYFDSIGEFLTFVFPTPNFNGKYCAKLHNNYIDDVAEVSM